MANNRYIVHFLERIFYLHKPVHKFLQHMELRELYHFSVKGSVHVNMTKISTGQIVIFSVIVSKFDENQKWMCIHLDMLIFAQFWLKEFFGAMNWSFSFSQFAKYRYLNMDKHTEAKVTDHYVLSRASDDGWKIFHTAKWKLTYPVYQEVVRAFLWMLYSWVSWICSSPSPGWRA